MRFSLLGFLFAALAATAAASPIKYTVSATATGSLNGVSFTDQLVTIVANGDTNDITGGQVLNIPVTATVSVAGVGSDSFTQNFGVFAYRNGASSAVGVGLYQWSDLLDVQDVAFASYDLTAPFGPVTGNALLNPNLPFTTVGGSFFLNSSQPSTFQAQAVPEPASLAALGLGALGILKRRKKA